MLENIEFYRNQLLVGLNLGLGVQEESSGYSLVAGLGVHPFNPVWLAESDLVDRILNHLGDLLNILCGENKWVYGLSNDARRVCDNSRHCRIAVGDI